MPHGLSGRVEVARAGVLLTVEKTSVEETVIMRSLHEVHEMIAYRAGHVCLSIRLHDLTGEALNGFG
jgi:hypothetical protein